MPMASGSSLKTCRQTAECESAGAIEHSADQAWFEAQQETHRFDGGLASCSEQLWLAIGLKQPLVFAQRLLDLVIARKRLFIKHA